MKKTIASVMFAAWLVLQVSPAMGAVAKPSIVKIGQKTKTSFTITVRNTGLKKKNAEIDVVVRSGTGTTAVKKFTVSQKMSNNGQTSIKVTGLRAHTEYSVKVRIKKKGIKSWSAYSSSKKVTTL